LTENYGASTIERARQLMKKYNIEHAVQIAPYLYVMRISVGNQTEALYCNTANPSLTDGEIIEVLKNGLAQCGFESEVLLIPHYTYTNRVR